MERGCDPWAEVQRLSSHVTATFINVYGREVNLTFSGGATVFPWDFCGYGSFSTDLYHLRCAKKDRIPLHFLFPLFELFLDQLS